MRRSSLLFCLIVLCATELSACGSKTVTATDPAGNLTTRTVANVHFAKTKFVLHTGLAIGAFKRYIANPLQDGGYGKGSPKRKRTIAKAVIAGGFILHELKQARDAAQSDDKLRGLGDKLGNVSDKLKAMVPSFATGNLDAGAVSGVLGGFGGISSAASALGATIKEHAPAL